MAELFYVFDRDCVDNNEALLMEKTDPNDPKNVARIIHALLVPSFDEYLVSSQKSYLDKLEFLLTDETEDFSRIFNFELQGGVFFGEDLVETRQFVEITYDIIKKEYEKNNNK